MTTLENFKTTVRNASKVYNQFRKVADRNNNLKFPDYTLEDNLSDKLEALHTEKARLVDVLLSQGISTTELNNIIAEEISKELR
jgi:hypothetical protein